MDEPSPDDVRSAVNAAAGAMRAAGDADWSVAARDLEWSCRRTLVHTISALVWYAGNLATQTTEDEGLPDESPTMSITELLRGLEIAGFILASVAEASPADARGYHGAGRADASGFLAMGIDETLVHAYDVCEALGIPFRPPPDVSDRTVRRLFPWAPEHDDPWERLLWCNGRVALPGHERLGPMWGWWCAPLNDWNGVPRLDRG
jgi:hypothetical protein